MFIKHGKGGRVMNSKILIAYFSRAEDNYVEGNIVNLPVGNTEIVMQMIAQQTGGKLFKIDPLKKYSSDYTTCTEEAKKDLRENARPELVEYIESIDEFDTIILGYPNYWGTMPMAVCTFLERYDFSGKTILPLCTHGGGGLGRSESDIKKLCPGADVRKGLAIRGSAVKNAKGDLERWFVNLGITK
jgi:flavodoxin